MEIVSMSDAYKLRRALAEYGYKSKDAEEMLQKFDDMEHELHLLRRKAEQAENRLIRWCRKEFNSILIINNDL